MVRDVACIGEIRIGDKHLVGKPVKQNTSRDVGLEGNMIFKPILK
jgi:hypothetical protein